MMISKKKYEELVQQSVELIKQKMLVQKLKENISKKCVQVKELIKIINQHKYLFKKTEKEREREKNERESRAQSEKRSGCSVSAVQEDFINMI